MKTFRLLPLAALLFVASVGAKEPLAPKGVASVPTMLDDASQSAYTSGWKDASGNAGFGGWKFQENRGADNAYAGHFIADDKMNPEIAPIASGDKAFGLYANGPGFETAVAFCPFAKALPVGGSFSFQMLNPLIEQKGTADSPAPGSIGLSLRSGDAASSPDDYNKGARFEIINLKGEINYQVYDGETTHDSGVPYSEKGITVTVTLTGVDTYDLEITRLTDNKSTKLSGRKFGGSGTIDSFSLFNRNGEKADAFFNRFQTRASGKGAPQVWGL